MNRSVASLLVLSTIALVSACSKSADVEVATVAEPPDIPRYSAAEFFATTSYGLPGPAGYAFSADGESLLISSDMDGVFNVYALPIDGGEPVKLTGSEDSAMFAVSWFPNDDRVLYTYDQGGNELNHVLVREEDGSHRDLTPGEELKASFVGWADDGQSFFLATTERNQTSFDLYRYSVEDYSREIVFENPGFQLSALSGDGRWLALDKPRTSADSDVYVVDLSADVTATYPMPRSPLRRTARASSFRRMNTANSTSTGRTTWKRARRPCSWQLTGTSCTPAIRGPGATVPAASMPMREQKSFSRIRNRAKP